MAPTTTRGLTHDDLQVGSYIRHPDFPRAPGGVRVVKLGKPGYVTVECPAPDWGTEWVGLDVAELVRR